MKLNEAQNHQIEAYLNNQLSIDERATFEAEIENNVDLKLALEEHKLVQTIVLKKKMFDLKSRMQNDIQKKNNSKQKGKIIFSIAIVSTVLISALYLFNNKTSEDTTATPDTIPSTTTIEKDNYAQITIPESIITEKDTTAFTEPSIISKPKYKPKFKPLIATPETIIPVVIPEQTVIDTIDSTNIPPEQEVKPTLEIPCNKRKGEAKSTITNSCANEPTGAVSITTITGGSPPYEYAIRLTSEENTELSFSTKKVFNDLLEGEYSIYAMDKNACKLHLATVTITTMYCPQNIELSYSIAYDNPLIIPHDDTQSGSILIYNRKNILIKEIQFSTNEEIVWNGESNDQATVDTGLYVYLIRYRENNTQEKGFITIH